MKIKASCSNGANWKQVDVKSRIPKELDKLEELARNMWWAWNHDARVLFRSLDEDLFDEVGQNRYCYWNVSVMRRWKNCRKTVLWYVK